MDSSLNFFRMFDLAFFAPGVLLFGVLWHAGCLPHEFAKGKEGVANEVLSVALAIGLIYLFGLFAHRIQRVLRRVLRLGFPNVACLKQSAWYTRFPGNADPLRRELAIYFWYLRTTCWNLAVAIGLSATFGFSYLSVEWFGPVKLWIVLTSVTLLLVWVGCEFNKSLNKLVDQES